jgi:ribosomal protein S18 acetylase RimI-like enzyme
MLSITTSVIQAAVESLLRGTTMPRSVNVAARTTSVTGVDVVSAAFSSFESAYVSVGPEFSLLNPGSVLLPASNQDRTAVYVSTSRDDYSIATLRLSVFSDFSPEMQSQFHARSCQAMQSRRSRGAICLVAKPAGSSPNALLGSAECSFHEFFGTRLGQKRPRNSILYVTEVAVNASARRRGVGLKLLQAVDRLAKLRGTETVYLHVETMNRAAIRLYEKAGYRQAIHDGQHPEKVSLFTEFTRSLNLHPGATQGRDHFLFYKDLVPKPTWLRNDEAVAKEAQHSRHQAPVGVLGFEIPA